MRKQEQIYFCDVLIKIVVGHFQAQPQAREQISTMRDMSILNVRQITLARTRQKCPQKCKNIQMRAMRFLLASQS